MKRSGSFVDRCGRYTRQPGSFFFTTAACSASSAARASPLPFAARIFATILSTSAIVRLSFCARALGVVIRAAQPAQRLRHVLRRRDVHLDPAAAREAPVRSEPGLAERARLIDGAQANPEIVLLLTQREAREELFAREVAPPSEHRGDAYAVPAPDGFVQARAGADAALPQRAAHLAPVPEPSEATGRRRHGRILRRTRRRSARPRPAASPRHAGRRVRARPGRTRSVRARSSGSARRI